MAKKSATGSAPPPATDFTNARIIFDGNSLTNSGVTNGYGTGPKYPEVIQATAPWTTNGATFYNFGVNGQQTQAMIDDAVSQIDSLYTPSLTCVVVAWEIGNDLYFNGNVTNAFNRFKTYCLARKAAGFKVVAINVTKRILSDPTVTPGGDTWSAFNAKVDTLNSMLAAQYTDFADRLVDVASDSRLDDPTDTAFYFDGVHHNGAGRVVVAGLVNSVLLTV